MKVVAAFMYLVLVVEAIPQKMALAGILVRVYKTKRGGYTKAHVTWPMVYNNDI